MVGYQKNIFEYIDSMWEVVNKDTNDLLNNLYRSKYICLFGAGSIGKGLVDDLKQKGISVDFFCDNNSKLWGNDIYCNIKCISPQSLQNYKDDVFVLISTGYYKEIYNQLRALQFEKICVLLEYTLKRKKSLSGIDVLEFKDNISKLLRILEDDKSREIVTVIVKNWLGSIFDCPNYYDIATRDQYFPEDIIRLSNKEIFVDVGAFDGDTIQNILAIVGEKFERIFAYELDRCNFQRLEDNIEGVQDHIKNKINLYNLGIYNESGIIQYDSNKHVSSINDSSDQTGKVIRLSDHLENEKLTFIKMDVEGAELKALYGAEDIIKINKPKLAICVYHELRHMWEIPLYIKSIVPEYKIFIRHHTTDSSETVCYAIIN